VQQIKHVSWIFLGLFILHSDLGAFNKKLNKHRGSGRKIYDSAISEPIILEHVEFFEQANPRVSKAILNDLRMSSRRLIKNKNNKKQPNILLLRLGDGWGGTPISTFSLYKSLLNLGCKINIIVPSNSRFHEELCDARLSHYALDMKNIKNKNFEVFLNRAVYKICLDENIDIVHSNRANEFEVAKKIKYLLGVKILAQFHTYSDPNSAMFKGFDAFSSPNPKGTESMRQKNIDKNLGIKVIEFVPSLCVEDNFLNFVPRFSKKEFFKNIFNIEIQDFPIVSVLANFYGCKNHEGLFAAVHRLVYEYNTPVQVMLAGKASTPERVDFLRTLVTELKLDNYIKFLGFTDEVPELLYHSDMKVLVSKGDAFPVVIFEAALMKKPIVLSKKAGSAEVLIKDNKNGLLCDPNDIDDIAMKIKRYINDPEFAKLMGKNAYDFATKYFSNENVAKMYKELYNKINFSK
jgi:glycosyltransferase involved in cell wall biosynthesis